MKQIYFNDWASLNWENLKGKEALQKDFEFTLTDEKIIFASYYTGGYEGRAYVLFEQDGKLYEVFGGHCSCYGLEDQWNPEEINLEYIPKRIELIDKDYQFDDLNREQKRLLKFRLKKLLVKI